MEIYLMLHQNDAAGKGLKGSGSVCASYGHYSDVTWALRCLKSLATRLFVEELVKTNNIKKLKALRYWPFVGGIPWIPLTKGQ